MAHTTISLVPKNWVNVGTYPCRVQAQGGAIELQVTSGAVPSNSNGCLSLQADFGITAGEMAEAFDGVATPTVVWAKANNLGIRVSVSNA